MSGPLSLWPWLMPRATMAGIAVQVAAEHGVAVDEMRQPGIVLGGLCTARDAACAKIYATGRYSWTQIGRYFRIHHTSAIAAAERHAERAAKGEDDPRQAAYSQRRRKYTAALAAIHGRGAP